VPQRARQLLVADALEQERRRARRLAADGLEPRQRVRPASEAVAAVAGRLSR